MRTPSSITKTLIAALASVITAVDAIALNSIL
jgi:hypothetical protein